MCKINHKEADALPVFLCRTCNPHLGEHSTVGAQTEQRSAESYKAQQARIKLRRKYDTERIRLDSMVATYGNAAKTAIEKQRVKVARLAKRLEG